MGVEFVKTVCPYCGSGCGLVLTVDGGRVVAAGADPSHPVSRGSLCIKGWTAAEFIHHPGRLTAPLLRTEAGFREISWDEALGRMAERFGQTVAQHGSGAVAGLSSARCTNEENYLFQKLIRLGLGSNNVDHCARLCHGPTVAAMGQMLGSGAMTNPIADLALSDCILAFGANPAETFPVPMGEIHRARRRGARLIVIDPRATEMAAGADRHLQIRPGTDILLASGMMRHILDAGLENRDFIAARTEDFAPLAEYLQAWPVERAAEACGLAPELIRETAEAFARAPAATIVFCMGITQHVCGTANVHALCDLALLCGQVGRPGAGICPLRGQCNVQGACDMGALPNVLPGYQAIADEAVRKRFAAVWGADPPHAAGLTITAAMAAAPGTIRALYIMGENPVMSDPNRAHTVAFLKSLDFLVVQDIFPTETTNLAHLVLPAACFAEKDGTFTNTERRVQRLRRAVDPPGQALDDLSILCRVARALGFDFENSDPGTVMAEIASLVPAYGGILYPRLGPAGLQWPCPDETHPGTERLHGERFPRGRALFVVPAWAPIQEPTDDTYPLVLITGRMFCHYHTGTMTRRSPSLHREAERPVVEINPHDAGQRHIADGDRVRVETRRGAVSTTARLSERMARGTIFAAFHFHEAPADALTNDALDPVSNVPELKACAAQMTREAACQQV